MYTESKYPIYVDEEYGEEFFNILITRVKMGIDIGCISEEINSTCAKYNNEIVNRERPDTGVRARKPLHNIICKGVEYIIYDVFMYDGQKYAYGIVARIAFQEQQIGAFFKIDNSDNIELIFRADMQVSDNDFNFACMFEWYTKFRRGLGVIPSVFKDVYMEKVESFLDLSTSDLDQVSEFANIDKEDLRLAKINKDESIEIMAKTADNLMTPFFGGVYKGIGCVFSKGNLYGNTFQGHYAGRLIKTPMKDKVALDLVPIPFNFGIRNIALTYEVIEHKKTNYLIEKPIYYSVDKVEFDSHTESSIVIKEIPFDSLERMICQDYYERFALINMQVKLQLPEKLYFVKSKKDIQ